MHPRLFDMLHDAADDDFFSIRKRVNIDFHSIIEEVVEQNRRIVRHLDGLAHIALQIARFMHDFHSTPA